MKSDTFTYEFGEGLIIKHGSSIYTLTNDLELEKVGTDIVKSKYSEIGKKLLQIIIDDAETLKADEDTKITQDDLDNLYSTLE